MKKICLLLFFLLFIHVYSFGFPVDEKMQFVFKFLDVSSSDKSEQKIETKKYFSRDFFVLNNIDPLASKVDIIYFGKSNIVDDNGHFIVIKLPDYFIGDKPVDFTYYVYKFEKKDKIFFMVPSVTDSELKWMNAYYQKIIGTYEPYENVVKEVNLDVTYEEKKKFIDELLSRIKENNKNKTNVTRVKLFDLISSEFIRKNDIDPLFTKINSEHCVNYEDYEIVDTIGPYVDIKCGLYNRVYRYKLTREENSLKVVPSRYIKQNGMMPSIYWQSINGNYDKLSEMVN
jgi:hypothetical protein